MNNVKKPGELEFNAIIKKDTVCKDSKLNRFKVLPKNSKIFVLEVIGNLLKIMVESEDIFDIGYIENDTKNILYIRKDEIQNEDRKLLCFEDQHSRRISGVIYEHEYMTPLYEVGKSLYVVFNDGLSSGFINKE